MLNFVDTYSRKDNIIYINDFPYIILLQNFCDLKIMTEQGIKYMNKYLAANPDLFEIHPMFDLY